jgi:hypothetical protein
LNIHQKCGHCFGLAVEKDLESVAIEPLSFALVEGADDLGRFARPDDFFI